MEEAPKAFELVHPADPRRVIRGRVHMAPGNGPRPWVLLIHGHRGFMDWAFLPELAKRIQAAEISSVAINLSGSGIGADLAEFTELELFAQNTYSRELEDLDLIHGAIDSGRLGPLDPNRGALFGHSRGGGMAILHEARFAACRALALWAPMHRVALFSEASLAAFRQDGHITYHNPFFDKGLRLNRSIIDDAEQHSERLDIQAACRRLTLPVLVLYGERDQLMEIGAADQLRQALGAKASVETVAGAGHGFGSRHPLRGISPALEHALGRTIAFLREHLLHSP